MLATLGAFFLGVGICAHALDELNGRPLGTRLSDPRSSHCPPSAWPVRSGSESSAWRRWALVSFPFIAAGAFIVVAYNLELFGGRFHTDFWFAAAWGAFPALTAYWANAVSLEPAGVFVTARLLCAQRRTAALEHAGQNAAATDCCGERALRRWTTAARWN